MSHHIQLLSESPLKYSVDGAEKTAIHFGPCTCPTGPHEWDFIVVDGVKQKCRYHVDMAIAECVEFV